jgi:3',5'-cyclic AMP phosphodiesterase CpdA
MGISAEEVAWLDADLAAHADAAWTVVFLHEPPFSSNSHGSSDAVQGAFVSAFETHGVDLVIAAHDHGYERSYPLREGAVQSTAVASYAADLAPVYIVTGGGGETLYEVWDKPTPAWSAAHESLYHVTEVRVTPDRLDVRVVPTEASEFSDAFSIVRAPTPTDAAPAAVIDTGIPTLGATGITAILALVAVTLHRRAR